MQTEGLTLGLQEIKNEMPSEKTKGDEIARLEMIKDESGLSMLKMQINSGKRELK